MRKIIDNEQGIMENEQLTRDNSELPKGWKYGTLEDVVQKGSSNISLNKVKDNEGEYQLFSAKGFAKNISFFQQEKEYLGIIKDGAGIGRISKYPAKSSIVATMQYLIPKDGFDIGFIEYFLKGIDFEKHRNGSTIPHIYFKDYKSESFPLLPLPEQKRIVSILDRAFEVIDKAKANAEQNLKNAKELFESYLQGVFENKGDYWEEKKLGEVCVINPKKSEVNNLPENLLVSFLPMKDLGIAQNQINPIITKPLSEVKGSYTYFRNEDVLLAKVTPCFENGKLGIAKNLKNKIGFGSSEYIVFRPKNKILSEYIFYILSNPKFRNKGKELMFGAVGLKRLSKDYVQNFVAPLPSLDEQQQIVKKLDSLSAKTKKLESIYQQKINDLEELKKSILQKAFNGKL